ncbi:MAG: nucleotidyltransferase domain-containing protein [Thermoproteota archaeon]
MLKAESLNKDLESIMQMLNSITEPCVKAILLFGSRARGENEEKSDIDLLVLHEDCGIHDAVLRRRYLYGLIRRLVGGKFSITLVDMELNDFLRPKNIGSLLLNIYCDALVLYDSTGLMEKFLETVRNRISASGLKRVRSGKAYYWILPEPLKEVKIL